MRARTKLFWLPVLFAFLFIQACSDDDQEMSREEVLLGTWTIQSSALTDYSITASGLTLTKDNVAGSPFEAMAKEFEESLAVLADSIFPPNTVITFNDDNTYLLTNPSSSDPYQDVWALSSDEQNLTIDLDNDDVSNLIFDIKELTASKLGVVLTLDENDINLAEDGGDELPVDDFTIEYTFDFTK